jgi:flagellar export protein FliJ
MSFSKLEAFLRLTIEEEKQAALKFNALKDDYLSAEDALKQALSYRVEYEEMSRGLKPSEFALIQLRAARSFLNNIDSLIENQRAILGAKREALEVRREQWQLLHAKTKSIEALITSRRKSHLLADEKKEQSRLDDTFGGRVRY